MSKVLIVDDDATIVRLMSQLLSEEGYDTTPALQPLRVYDAVKREAPDVILLDLMMPYLDGWDELRLLSLDPQTRDIPVIFVTAKRGAFDELTSEERAAFFDFMYKPFEIDQLVEKVRRACESGAQRKETTTSPTSG
jgi:CheY-like chemotaxis protein